MKSWQIDRPQAAAWTTLIFFFSSLYLSGSLLKSLVLAVAVAGCCVFNHGRRWLERLGFVLLTFTMIVFLGLLPPINTLPASIRSAIEGTTAFFR